MKLRLVGLLVGLLMVAAPLLGVLHQQVSGTWVLAVDLDIGQGGEATFVLSQEGDEISGTYSGALGQDVPVTGKVTEDGVEFSFDSQAGTVTYKGKIEGNTMKGTCVYGQLGGGSFEGERKE